MKKKIIIGILLLILVLATGGFFYLWQHRTITSLPVTKKILTVSVENPYAKLLSLDCASSIWNFDDSMKFSPMLENLCFSPDHAHTAYIGLFGGKIFMVLDGKRQKEYDAVNFADGENAKGSIISDAFFSPNSARFAYTVESMGEASSSIYRVVVDGIEQGDYDEIKNAHFNSDSSHFSYIAKKEGKEFAVIDGIEQKKYDSIFLSTLSDDAIRWAFTVSSSLDLTDPNNPKQGFSGIVLDGKETDDSENDKNNLYSFESLTFSPDSQHFAYVALSEQNEYVLFLDGVKQPFKASLRGQTVNGLMLGIRDLTFSPDSSELSYSVITEQGSYVVRGQTKGPLFDNISGMIVYSPNSKRMAYEGERGNKRIIVLDGAAQKEYDKPEFFDGLSVYSFVFSPDSQHFAYKIKQNEKLLVVVDGNEQTIEASEDSAFSFSPNGKRFAYIASEQAGEMFAVIDGAPQKEYQYITDIIFSPDSKRVVYLARTKSSGFNENEFIVLDGVEQKIFQASISSLVFSPDSKHIAYVVSSVDENMLFPYHMALLNLENEKDIKKQMEALAALPPLQSESYVVIDEVEKEKFNTIGAIKFKKNVMYYNAYKDNELWQIVNELK